MKAVRILQFFLLLIAAGYLFLVENRNPDSVILPYMLPLPTGVVIGLALALGWLTGWLPSRLRIWRLNRENRKLQARLSELEPAPYYDPDEPSAPVIPDRDVTRTQVPSHRSETENI